MFFRSTSVTKADVIWAYQLLLQRAPENEAAVDGWVNQKLDIKTLVEQITSSEEFTEHQKSQGHHLALSHAKYGFLQPFNIYEPGEVRSYGFGDYEPEESACIQALCRTGDLVVDLGARHGWFTGLMATAVGPTGCVQSFDPEDVRHYIDALVSANNFSNVSFAQVAASDKAERLLFNPIDATMGAGPQSIEAVRLDEFMAARKRPVKLMKIDIEGAEFKALQGALGILKTDRPTIMMELNEPYQRRVSGVSVQKLLNMLREIGYAVETLDLRPADLTEIQNRLMREVNPINVVLRSPSTTESRSSH